MTALSGPIIFNNSGSGSDTQASGCGPSSAITVNMMVSSGSNSTSSAMWSGTISAGDIVYFNTSTGRKFNVVASANNSVGFQSITFDETWDDNISGNAYCGGKRSTIDNADSRRLFAADCSARGWEYEIEYTGTDYALTSKLNISGRKTITGTGSSRPSISISNFADTVIEVTTDFQANAILDDYHFKFLDFSASATRTFGVDTAPFSMTNGLYHTFDDCSFNNGTGDFQTLFETTTNVILRKCTLTGSTISSYRTSGDGSFSAIGCNITGGSNGVVMDNGGICSIVGCTFDSVSGIALSFSGGCAVNNIFYNCGTGVRTGPSSASRGLHGIVYGNIFDSCTTGITGYSALGVTGNNFNGNTTNTSLTDSDTGTNPNSLNVSLLTDPANDDFTLDASGSVSAANFAPLGVSSSSGDAPALESRPMRAFDDTASGGIRPVSLNGGMNG